MAAECRRVFAFQFIPGQISRVVAMARSKGLLQCSEGIKKPVCASPTSPKSSLIEKRSLETAAMSFKKWRRECGVWWIRTGLKTIRHEFPQLFGDSLQRIERSDRSCSAKTMGIEDDLNCSHTLLYILKPFASTPCKYSHPL